MRYVTLASAGLWLALLVSCTLDTSHLYGTGERPDAMQGEAEAEAEAESESESEAEAEGDAGGRDDAGDPRRDGGMQPDVSQDASPPTVDAPPDVPPDIGPDAGVPPADAAVPDPDATPVEPDANPGRPDAALQARDAGPDAAPPEPDSGVVIILPDAILPESDLGADAGPDAGSDAGPDLGPDAGSDAAVPDEYPACPADNWLVNPGFEAPIGETWVDTGPGGTLTRDCAVAWEGACSARLETDGVSGGEVQLRQSSIPTVSGSTEICFFARADREVRVELEVASPASPRFGAVWIGTAWKGVCAPRDIGEERELRIVLDNPATPQTVWFDEIHFGPIECP